MAGVGSEWDVGFGSRHHPCPSRSSLHRSAVAVPFPTMNPSCPGQRPDTKLLLENWEFIPGQEGFSQNWVSFREDYTLIAPMSTDGLLAN